MEASAFYNPFEQMNLDPDACFLCGGIPDQHTREHVFPLWLLQREQLLDKSLTLLNGTTIRYSQLTVPCCPDCNHNHLARLEQIIERASARGVDALMTIPTPQVFQWMAKIFIGILWAELRLRGDRAEINGGPIISPEIMEEYATLHGHLQSVRRPFIFEEPTPWSLFFSRLHRFDTDNDFDYKDDVLRLCFSIRFSGVGIIACLQDNNTQKELYGDYWEPFVGVPLHWQQWEEMWAKIAYRNTLLRRIPKYINMLPESDSQPVHILSLRTGGFAPETMWDDWDQEAYANVLLFYMKRKAPWLTIEDVFVPPDKVMSWLFKADGSINAVDVDGQTID